MANNTVDNEAAGRRFSRWWPVVLWMALIFVASSIPTRLPTPGLQGFRWDDKLQHAVAYAILAALAWRAFEDKRPRWWLVCASIIFAVAYAAFDECHQAFVPTRECSLSDWSTDAFGAAAAALVLDFLKKGGDGIGRQSGARKNLRSER